MDNIVPFGVIGNQAPKLHIEELPDIQLEMVETIERMDQYALNRGKLGGFDTGYKLLNEAIEGLNTGLHLIAGQSNVGKSALCLHMAWNVAQKNREVTRDRPYKAFVLYFSLDDNANTLLPRIISIDKRVPINVVRFPSKYEDMTNLMVRRREGIEDLKDSVGYFKMVDSTKGDTLEYIEEEIKRHQLALGQIDETYKLVVFIDNFHDLSVRDVHFNSDTAKFDYLPQELSRICTTYDIPIVCTAEFRKLNGNKRPTIDDIKEATKIGYEAQVILLCYNEVGIRGESASIWWNDPSKAEKQPVLEAKVGKNKQGSYKGRIFFNFLPEYSTLIEADKAQAARYNQMITS
jgi:replicative DNA helicase